ncbi:integrin alpha-6-like isoform X2 [Denticeps clupeoides]|uniref:Integrin alpha-2 domain-containing protein n=1 Tax=Denticeps clupeoides TaxID=299321 RepID=A0AAY4EPE9_9TELE|nr:integrin alpha-6-like isoform X2 [Denticeps clupeoides]XP_028836640.1 integrin alpha-6-like isoform X2 [Denticeps clupeoides]
MHPRGTLALLLCALLLLRRRAAAFNLDTENAVTRSGDPDSLFGFSLAMHRQLQPSEKRMLLVGAPRAKALGKQQATITGGLYTCDINAGCTRVDFDKDENIQEESKQNQWMGVTVQSQGPGGKVLTCAHRYERRNRVNSTQESRDITGRCFVLSQDLTINPRTDEDGGNWKFCQGRTRGHEKYGSCQQGLSATFTKDYHYLVFGAPGAFNWKGIVRVEQKNATLVDMGLYFDGPFESTAENKQQSEELPVPASSYLGFSLDSGKAIVKKGELTVVAGAPRAYHSGAVVFLKKIEQTTFMERVLVLEGEGLASSFGYDLTVLDLNADGWEDLVVGAPQHFVRDGDAGGAIYVYLNQGGVWDKLKPIRIEGTKDSMFGLAVENIGDINLDGFQDVAVGAPYDNNGAGNVFIYHGTNKKFSTKPAQVLSAKDPNIKLFGYSLAGNMDLDMNSYPDIAVGSLSNVVNIYRARPVISIQKVVTTTPSDLDLTKKNCGDSICLTIEACFSYTAKPEGYSPKVVVNYTIQAEGERRNEQLPSRVQFRNPSPGDTPYQSTGTLELLGQNQKKCITKELKLQDNIKDKVRRIPIEVMVNLQDSPRVRRQSNLPQLKPVLDASQPASVLSSVNFLKEGCGSDNVCESNLQLKYRFCSREPNKDVFTPLPLDKDLPLISLSDQKEIALEVTVTNKNGDDAYETYLNASMPGALSYSASRTLNMNKQVACGANQDGSNATCELGNPFKRDSEVTFYIILNTGGISLKTTEVDIHLKLFTTSRQNVIDVDAKAKVVIELMLSVIGGAKPTQVFFGGESKGESAMTTETDIGSHIDYEFRISNFGKPLKHGTPSLTIQWPKYNKDGKWLLYLMKITTEGITRTRCTNEQEVNMLKVNEDSTASRTKRDVGGDADGKFSFLFGKRKNKTLSCSEDAKCVQIKCPLTEMKSTALVRLSARLWNTTFLEDYPSMNYLDLVVTASLNLDGADEHLVLKDSNTLARVTVFPEKKSFLRRGGVAWWIILVAILLGLLLLGLLAFLLWKCGFFGKDNKGHDSSKTEKLTSDA